MSGTICIVDDEPSILNTLSSILEDEGYQVTLAKNGGEALKVIQMEPPDVVILDIWMPELDGLEVLTRVRELFPNMMVIMMSGHGSVETAVKATKLGAYDYLEKPLDLEKVTILVRNALNQRKLEEENINLRVKVERHSKLVGASVRDGEASTANRGCGADSQPRSDFRGKRNRARNWWRGPSICRAPAIIVRLLKSIVRRFPRR